MLRLKKLQIIGFKSFGDRTDLAFPGHGVVGVVGPNGCGKSNLADAIGWVLGEQSAKSLRGQRMEDVIFSGTRDRPATGWAEVSLTLLNPEEAEGGPTLSLVPEAASSGDNDQGAAADSSTASEPSLAVVADAESADEGAEGAAAAAAAENAWEEEWEEVEAAPARAEAASSPADVVLTVRRRRRAASEHRRGEIVITRRLYRGGESEYRMNGRLCRLRDIQELFLGTGLGPESYAIIEQGRIGQILSSKPYDRRALIEEAAGVTKYKARKKLTEAKLESARQNLARVQDIFDEVGRQLNSLRRQAAKARRCAEFKRQLDAARRRLLLGKAAQIEAELERLAAARAESEAELRTRGAELAAAETGRGEWYAAVAAQETELRAAGDRLAAWTLELDRTERQLEFNQRQIEDLARRENLLAEEITALSAEQERGEQEARRAAAEWDAAAEQARVAAAVLAERRAVGESGEREQQVREERLRAARARLLTGLGRLGQLGGDATQCETLLAALDRQSARLEAERGDAHREMDALGVRRGQLRLDFTSRREELDQLLAALAARERRLASLAERRAEEAAGRDEARDALARAAARRESLDEIVAHHGYSSEAVRALLAADGGGRADADRGFHPLGVLADFLEVEPQYEAVVEEFLREELNYVVVKNWDEADAGVGLLRQDAQGRATFLVHPEDGQYAMFAAEPGEGAATDAAPTAGATPVPLRHCVRVLNGFGRSLERILPKLGGGFILPDPSQARELAARNPEAYFLTAGGECFHNQTVTGGARNSAGPLSLKRELRELGRREAELAAAIARRDAALTTLAVEMARLEEEQRRDQLRQREWESELAAGGRTLEQVEGEVQRVAERLRAYELEAERGRAERLQTEIRLEELRDQRAAAESDRAAAEAEEEGLVASLAGARRQREEWSQTLAAAQSEAARWEERARAAEESRARAARALEQIATRRTQAQSDFAALGENRAVLAASLAALTARGGELAAARSAGEREREDRAAHLDELRAAGADWESRLASARKALEAARQAHGEQEVALARLQSDAGYLDETSRAELNLGLLELRARAESEAEPPIAAEEIPRLDEESRELRARIEALGAVNMMALEECDEIEKRFEFLAAQRQDLLDSIADAEKAIAEIDAVSRQQFNAAFERINEFFQAAFARLFGGGQGFLRLADLENDPEGGVDIVAQPPGKKLQNALLLSGGEKAMTAMALLLAIFQHQPSPFCLLDEVDAPLDDANVGRFTEMVAEMSRDTQFIMITHNPRTMECAAMLYGVTMPRPGISRLVSVALPRARAIAATAAASA